MDDENMIIFDPLGELQRLAEELEKINEEENQ